MNKESDKKNVLFRATKNLISKNGFHGTPMSQIAKEAGISIGIIYHYFSSKEELLNKLYLEIKKNFAAYVVSRISDNLSDQENLTQTLQNIFSYYTAYWDELSFSEQYENSPLITEETHKQVFNLLEPVIDLFESARQKGILKPLPAGILITLSFGAVVFLAKYSHDEGRSIEEESIQAGLDAVWDLIKF
jgi:AcrR family transcriptional regulator